MFIVLLKLTGNKEKLPEFMSAHKAWIQTGYDDGVFLTTGTLEPQQGGCIIAHNTTRKELDDRVEQDPFVRENIVTPEILEVTPANAEARLSFLLENKD